MNPRRPFTWADGLAAGRTPRQLRGSAFVSPFRGVYVESVVDLTPRLLAEAALVVAGAGAFLCHGSAATLLGSGDDATGFVDVGVVDRDRPRVAGIRGHRYASVPPTIQVGRLPVTSPEQTFVDLASAWSLVRLVTTGDQFVAQRWTTPERLVTTAAQASGRGARLARDAAALVRTGVESRWESPSRLLLVLAGLPEPVVNYPITDGAGRSRRVDLAYPELKLAIEYDGRHHIERENQWRNDLLRREDVEALGWRFIVLTSPDIFVTPGRTIDRVATAMRSRGAHVTPRAGWQLHFAGRAQVS